MENNRNHTPIMDDTQQILLALIIVFISIVIYIIYKRSKTTRRSILLTGICDSGKTVLHSLLIHQKDVQSFTSIKANIGEYVSNKGSLKIVDIPGHERLRYKYIDEHKNSTKGIVFVVDSLAIQDELKDAAEYLYNILCDDVLRKNKVNILILCNKQDHTLAKECTAIKAMFEKELNTLQNTKSLQVENLDPNSKKLSLGDGSKDFSFHNFILNVEFAGSIAHHSKNGKNDIDNLEKWLAKLS
ncbi:signal recognition particle receptor subunit beta [Coccinella septempunctata]|uniref:signal recognition particle receptor subunit beta n=1 Tax=Coccinella septempunctata TaxID=41139 RepID=UPI001D07F0B0|nr:signal recognition particle receptor subunit beta [Coccinella septempunctata]